MMEQISGPDKIFLDVRNIEGCWQWHYTATDVCRLYLNGRIFINVRNIIKLLVWLRPVNDATCKFGALLHFLWDPFIFKWINVLCSWPFHRDNKCENWIGNISKVCFQPLASIKPMWPVLKVKNYHVPVYFSFVTFLCWGKGQLHLLV